HGPIVWIYRSLYGETGSSSLSVARFVISLILLLIPTTCMGATLPILSHYLTELKDSLGRTAGALYAVNTFGAVAGAVTTGFFLLPQFGKLETNGLAVAGNLLLGLIAASAGSKQPNATPTPPVDSNVSAQPISPPVRMAVAAFAISGFAGMATQ